MEGKRYRLTINGFPVEAEFPRREMEQAIDPLIDALLALRGRLSRRAVAFLSGPPGAGKSTLAEVLCARAAERQANARVQALGLDGFHYPNAYLNETYRTIDGARTRLRDVKGRPETFDVRHFAETLARARTENGVVWPRYDRTTHDVDARGAAVTGDVLLVEGNWLLLDAPGWNEARTLCDCTIALRAPEPVLRKRLLARKMRGGLSRAEAETWYARVDGPNVARFENGGVPADYNLMYTENTLKICRRCV